MAVHVSSGAILCDSVNVPELMGMVSAATDIKTKSDLNLPIPLISQNEEGQRLPRGGLDGHQDSYARSEFVAHQVMLYESVLTKQGPRYDPRLTVELSA